MVLDILVAILCIFFIVFALSIFVLDMMKKEYPPGLCFACGVSGMLTGLIRFAISGSDFFTAMASFVIIGILFVVKGYVNMKREANPKIEDSSLQKAIDIADGIEEKYDASKFKSVTDYDNSGESAVIEGTLLSEREIKSEGNNESTEE